MKGTPIFLALSVMLLSSCETPVAPRAATTTAAHKSSLNATGDRAEFKLRGITYGADGGELTNSTCSGTYAWTSSKQVWYASGTDTVSVDVSEYRKTGCVLGTGGGGDVYVGGNVSIGVGGPNGEWVGGGINADQTESLDFTEVPVQGSTVYLSASAWSGFVFRYWIVTRSDWSTYIEYSADFTRPANTTDYDFQAVFTEYSPTGW